jgi:hypothetical protein
MLRARGGVRLGACHASPPPDSRAFPGSVIYTSPDLPVFQICNLKVNDHEKKSNAIEIKNFTRLDFVQRIQQKNL